jgi:hypothetical protein
MNKKQKANSSQSSNILCYYWILNQEQILTDAEKALGGASSVELQEGLLEVSEVLLQEQIKKSRPKRSQIHKSKRCCMN